jgi:hypothetical protein
MWSFGSVKLGPIRASGRIAIEVVKDGAGNPTDQYQLYRVYDAQGGEAKAPLIYADFHPDSSDPPLILGYLYDLKFVDRAGGDNLVDIYAHLRRSAGGSSFDKARQIYVGVAKNPIGQAFTEVDVSNELKVSEIVEGSFLGRWAFHPAAIPRDAKVNQGVECDLRLNPGAYRNQIADPSRKYTCVPKPGVEEACAGNPFAEGCLPPLPQLRLKKPTKFEEFGETDQLVKVTEQVYTFAEDGSKGEILFVSTLQAMNDKDNAQYCSDRFFALARTVDDYVHPVCEVKLGSSGSSRNGKAACRVLVSMNSPISYLEKPCKVHAQFMTDNGEEDQLVQVIHR